MGEQRAQHTGDRLRAVADRLCDGNKSELARSLQMKPSSFSKYLQGTRRPGATVLERISQLGVNVHWLLTGDGPMMRAASGQAIQPLPLQSSPDMGPSELDGPDGPIHRVPLVRVTVNEDGAPQLEEIEAAEWLSASYIRRVYGVPPDQLKGFRISGNSMQSTIRPGERVRAALWRGESLTDGAVYLIYSRAGVIVRRVHLNGDEIVLGADHAGTEDLHYEADQWTERVRPIARVLEVVRSL